MPSILFRNAFAVCLFLACMQSLECKWSYTGKLWSSDLSWHMHYWKGLGVWGWILTACLSFLSSLSSSCTCSIKYNQSGGLSSRKIEAWRAVQGRPHSCKPEHWDTYLGPLPAYNPSLGPEMWDCLATVNLHTIVMMADWPNRAIWTHVEVLIRGTPKVGVCAQAHAMWMNQLL